MKKSILMTSFIVVGLTFFAANVMAAAKITCNPGEYVKGSGKNQKCERCEAGYYCQDGKNRKICPVGSRCPEGATAPIACTGNEYTNTTKQSSCKACSGANQIVNSRHTGCTTCPLKKEPNPEHTACVNKCAAGQYVKGSNCQSCEAGYYCPDGKNHKACPVGSYCPAGATAPVACTGNTYTNATGQSSCKTCDGANQIVNSHHTGCTNCSAKQQPNEQHTACENRCTAGQYVKGKDCQSCEAGYYCPDGKNRNSCPMGSYCPAGVAAPTACTGNTYTNNVRQSSCQACSGANQIVNSNHTGCSNCPAKQQPNADHTACENRCTAGQYVKSSGKNKTCEPCEAGYYCPDGRNPKACPVGSYCPAGATAPVACTGNMYTNATRQSSCKACNGENQIVNSNHTGCIVGNSRQKPNETHTAFEAKCVPGQYVKGKNCQPCEAGYYCPDGKSRRTCPAKHYCPGTGSTAAVACPANATCTDRKTFKCKKNFRQQGNSCVK